MQLRQPPQLPQPQIPDCNFNPVRPEMLNLRVEKSRDNSQSQTGFYGVNCPHCSEMIVSNDVQDFCLYCGQLLDIT